MLEEIIEKGNRGHNHHDGNVIKCVDGFSVSVIAGGGTYCAPRPAFCSCSYFKGDKAKQFIHEPDGMLEHVQHDYPGPYNYVEVGFPSEKPEPWEEWINYADGDGNPTETVYGYVPVQLVRDLIELHGGEA